MPFPEPTCRDDARRAALLASALNGIDYLEVLPGQLQLLVVFFKPVGAVPTTAQVRVEGGVRVRNVRVLSVAASGPQAVEVTLDRFGDYSTYTLVLDPAVPLDPYYARVEFSFKVDCPSRFDCRPRADCPPADEPAPPIDYLAKDYASFRQALLDLLAARLPGWRERHEADLGVALVEVLAAAGDHLSYLQDAVANEAYLETARQRVSVRRHARLIDYRVDDGSTARVLVHCAVPVGQAGLVKTGTRFVTRLPRPLGPLAEPGPLVPVAHAPAAEAAGLVFEAVADAALDGRLTELKFHTWGNARCCLSAGATRADFKDPGGNLTAVLKPGALLVIEEVLGPETGAKEDADPGNRQVVRVATVAALTDPVLNEKVVRVTWPAGDALRTGFCLSLVGPGGAAVPDVSVARGNLVLADQGRKFEEWHPTDPAAAGAAPVKVGHRPYRFSLRNAPLAFIHPLPAAPADPADPVAPAADLFATDPRTAGPWLAVVARTAATAPDEKWEALPDLLASGPLDTHVTAETDDAGRAVLRFGDNVNGRSPDRQFVRATYRVGGGSAANVATGAVAHVLDDGTLTGLITGVRSPLPAWGGADPEPVERVKRVAPDAFRTGLYRAVTEADYARAAELHPEVAKAAARFRWTGSWRTVYVLIDPKGRADLPPELRDRVHRHLTRFALAGYDLEVRPATYVPLEVEVEVCVGRGHFRGDVEEAVLAALGRAGGFFDPDRFTFGEPVYLSRLVAAVVAVPGVSSVRVTRLRRTDESDPDPTRPATAANLAAGRVAVGRFEVARLDNDPSFPENGTLRLTMLGGR